MLLLAEASPPGTGLPPTLTSAFVLKPTWAGPRRTVQGEGSAALAWPAVRHSAQAARIIGLFGMVGLLVVGSDVAVEADLFEGHAVTDHEQVLHRVDHGQAVPRNRSRSGRGRARARVRLRCARSRWRRSTRKGRWARKSTTVAVSRSWARASSSAAAPSSASLRRPSSRCTRRTLSSASTPRATDNIGPSPEPPATHTTSRAPERSQA